MLIRLLLIAKNYQNLGKYSIKSSLFSQRAKKASDKGRSPPQELKEGQRSGPHLLVGDIKNSVAYSLSILKCELVQNIPSNSLTKLTCI